MAEGQNSGRVKYHFTSLFKDGCPKHASLARVYLYSLQVDYLYISIGKELLSRPPQVIHTSES